MPFSIIPFLLLIVPILEIGVFIAVGGQIGVLSTLGMILLTAIIGSILLRWQGFQVLNKLQAESTAGRVPGKELVHGAMILVAGILLLTPGFVTDSIGFLLFVPGIRNVIWSFIASKVKFASFGGMGANMGQGSAGGFSEGPFRSNSNHPDGDIVDLDPDDFSDVPNPDTPWGDNQNNKPSNQIDKK